MASRFDIGARVQVKDTSPLHPGERGVIVRLGLATDATAWKIEFAHGNAEIPESELELFEESHL
jgi:hypothetical protein